MLTWPAGEASWAMGTPNMGCNARGIALSNAPQAPN